MNRNSALVTMNGAYGHGFVASQGLCKFGKGRGSSLLQDLSSCSECRPTSSFLIARGDARLGTSCGLLIGKRNVGSSCSRKAIVSPLHAQGPRHETGALGAGLERPKLGLREKSQSGGANGYAAVEGASDSTEMFSHGILGSGRKRGGRARDSGIVEMDDRGYVNGKGGEWSFEEEGVVMSGLEVEVEGAYMSSVETVTLNRSGDLLETEGSSATDNFRFDISSRGFAELVSSFEGKDGEEKIKREPQEFTATAAYAQSSDRVPSEDDSDGEEAWIGSEDVPPLTVDLPGGRRVVELLVAWDVLAPRLLSGSAETAASQQLLLALKLSINALRKAAPPEDGRPRAARALSIACTLADLRMDGDTVAAGLLREAVEAGTLSISTIEREMGSRISQLVLDSRSVGGVSQRTEVYDTENSQALCEFCLAFHSVQSIVIELAGRVDAMRHLRNLPRYRQQIIALETLQIYAPLAHIIGTGSIMWELEDTAFRVLFPSSYESMAAWLSGHWENKEEVLEDCRQQLLRGLQTDSVFQNLAVDVTIVGRCKSLYSTMKKLLRDGRDRHQVYDILGLRVILTPRPHATSQLLPEERGVQACYRAREIAVQLWPEVLARSKDYIAMPKSNGYQSLHLAVHLDDEKTRPVMELQIRTAAMDSLAVHGVASHGAYKGGFKDPAQVKQLKELVEPPLGAAVSFFGVPPAALEEKPASTSGLDKRMFEPAEEPDHIFKMFDANGDGVISVEEFKQVMSDLGSGPQEDDAQELMTLVDINADGSVTFEEFNEFRRQTRIWQDLHGVDNWYQKEIGKCLPDAPRQGHSNIHTVPAEEVNGTVCYQEETQSREVRVPESAANGEAVWMEISGTETGESSVNGNVRDVKSSQNGSFGMSTDEVDEVKTIEVLERLESTWSDDAADGGKGKWGSGRDVHTTSRNDEPEQASATGRSLLQAEQGQSSGAHYKVSNGGFHGAQNGAGNESLRVKDGGGPSERLGKANGVDMRLHNSDSEERRGNEAMSAWGGHYDGDEGAVSSLRAKVGRLKGRRPILGREQGEVARAGNVEETSEQSSRSGWEGNMGYTSDGYVTDGYDSSGYSSTGGLVMGGGRKLAVLRAPSALKPLRERSLRDGEREETEEREEFAARRVDVGVTYGEGLVLVSKEERERKEEEVGAKLEEVRKSIAERSLSHARATLQRLCRLYPEDGRVWTHLASLERKCGNLAAARSMYIEATHAFRQRDSMGADYARALQAWGTLEAKAYNPEKARVLFLDSIAAARMDGQRTGREWGSTAVFGLHAWAMLEEKQGNYAKARELLSRAAELQPGNSVVHLARALLEAKAHNYAEATLHFELAVNSSPRDVKCWQAFALFEARGRRPERMRELFQKALEIDPSNTHALQAWAHQETLLRTPESLMKARQLYKKCVEVEPKSLHAWQAWAIMEEEAGNFDHARRLFEKGLQANPTNVHCLQAFARMEISCGNVQAARDLLQTAIALQPDNAPSLMELGQLEKGQGNLIRADELFLAASLADKAKASVRRKIFESRKVVRQEEHAETIKQQEQKGKGGKKRSQKAPKRTHSQVPSVLKRRETNNGSTNGAIIRGFASVQENAHTTRGL